MEITDRDADDLNRPEGNGLKANYDKHGVGEREFVERCDGLGFVVEEWGIKMPEEAAGKVTYDDAMDFKVYVECDAESADAWLTASGSIVQDEKTEGPKPGAYESPLRLAALVDVKTKSGPRYMGRFNKRHFENYAGHARTFGVPTFVVMFQVDGSEGTVHDEFVFEVPDHPSSHVDEASLYRDEVLCSTYDDTVDPFPDGNHAVVVNHRYREDWETFVGRVTFQRDLDST